jgi:CPA2 family monovalent cation:H+ antiporter-2
MLVSVTALFDHLWVSIPIVIVAVFGKLVANYVGAYLVGHSREEASTIGILMVPRGEFSYVIAKQGVDLNAAKEAIYPITVFVSFVSMLVLPALMRLMPTIVDQRTIIPVRLFMLTELVVQIVRNLMQDIQRAKVVQGLRMLIPKLMVNVAVTAVILSIISLADQYIFSIYLAFPTLQTVSYETFKLILSLAAIAYPIVSIFGGTQKIAEMLFDAVQYRIVKAPILTGGMHYIHRIIRNMVLAVTLLLVSDFVTPSISIITGLENILSIMSLITLGVFIYFILDTIFVINRRLEKSLISSLLAPSDDDEEEKTS